MEKERKRPGKLMSILTSTRKVLAAKNGHALDVGMNEKYFAALYECQGGVINWKTNTTKPCRCFYTGQLISLETSGTGHAEADSKSIDKVINELGYTLGNVVFSNMRTNMLKNDLSLRELKDSGLTISDNSDITIYDKIREVAFSSTPSCDDNGYMPINKEMIKKYILEHVEV